jgi:hypothetical protein
MALWLPSCSGWGTFPTSQPRPCGEATSWEIGAFTGADVVAGDGILPPAVAMDVGESRRVRVEPPFNWSGYTGCNELVSSVTWRSTSPAIADFESSADRFWLTAYRPGDTEISAEVTLSDGRRFHAELGSFAEFQGQPVRRVRVFEPAVSAGRQVVSSGTTTLAPNPAGTGPDARLPFQVPSAGTLDMVVDWRSVANRVTAHVCPGPVAVEVGCVPVIDGNQSSKDKPQVGSARVTPGPYWLWITNAGPDSEVIRYETGLVPDGR